MIDNPRPGHPSTASLSNQLDDVPDDMTVVHSFGPRLAKQIVRQADGSVSIEGFENARNFSVESLALDGLEALAGWLERYENDRRSAVIRAALRPGVNADRVRRTLHEQINPDGALESPCFRAKARRWVALDLDGIPVPEAVDPKRGLIGHLVGLLPTSFAGADLILQFTGSAGFKPGIRARLWFWLDRAVSGSELKRWFARRPVDPACFGDVQLIYIARPVLIGTREPHPKRIHFLKGAKRMVGVPDLKPPSRTMPPNILKPRRGSRYATAALVRACIGIGQASEGRRHATLNREAFCLAQFIAAGDLNVSDVISALVNAARHAGLTDSDSELLRFIRTGLQAGAHRAEGGG